MARFDKVTVKFPGTRKVRECVVYPRKPTDRLALIQADDAIARVDLNTGDGLFAVHAGGAYSHHLLYLGKPFTASPELIEAIERAGHVSVDGTIALIGQ
jgi:hypothetical protein